MNLHIRVTHLFFILFLALGLLIVHQRSVQAIINEECHTPVELVGPINDGAKVVAFRYGTSGCDLMLFVNGTDLIALRAWGSVGSLHFGQIHLDRKVKQGDIVIVKQGGLKGTPSKPLTVRQIPSNLLIDGERFPPPVLPPPRECQAGIWVEGLVPGGVRALYELFGAIPDMSSLWTPYGHDMIAVTKGWLETGDQVGVWQDQDSKFPKPSKKSKQTVQKMAGPLLKPWLEAAPLGAKSVRVCDVHAGLPVVMYERDPASASTVHARGFAKVPPGWTGCAIWGVGALKYSKLYCVQQFRCREKSAEPLSCIKPSRELAARRPEIQKPVCPGDDRVTVKKTSAGLVAEVVVTRKSDGSQFTSTASTDSPTTVVMMNSTDPLKAGDKIKAKQGYVIQDSHWSPEVIVEQSRQVCENRPPSGGRPPFPIVGASSPGKAQPAQPPATSSGCKTVCKGNVIPAGYIWVDSSWDPTKCGTPPISTPYNLQRVCRYDNFPVGAAMNVCAGAPIPSGWQETNRWWDPNKCEGKPSIKKDTVKRIVRIK